MGKAQNGEGGFNAQGDLGQSGDPVKVKFFGEWYLPQELSAFTLMKMKEIAEHKIDSEIRDAVVTVPAYFTEKQRKATEEATKLAGLYPRQLIPEPTAAAICYGLDQYEERKQVYLVYDLGGGTFDVSIITVKEERIQVIATSGDPRLGGGDFDDAIVRWAVAELKDRFQLDVSNDPRAQAIIKYSAEEVKKALSIYESEKLVLMALRPEQPPILELTRENFEELIAEDLGKSFNYVDEALRLASENAGVQRDDIDAILLVGGSTRIPCVKQRLLEYFDRDDDFVRDNLDPDTVVARGAAILAKRYKPTDPPFDIERDIDDAQTSEDENDVVVHHITEHSLGIGVVDEAGEHRVSRILSQGTNIPVASTRGGFTNAGPTTELLVQVYQGEGDYVVENELIGVVPIEPIVPMPANHHKFEVTFSLNRSGLLTAVVNHLNEGNIYQAQFEHKTGIGGNEALARIRDKLLLRYGSPHTVVKEEKGPTPDEFPPPPGPRSSTAEQPPVPDPEPASGEALASGTPINASELSVHDRAKDARPSPTDSTSVQRPDEGLSATTKPSEPAPTIHGHGEENAADQSRSPAAVAPLALPSAVEVPESLRRIVRRSRQLLQKNADPSLIKAYNKLVFALTQGADGKELDKLGDELEDTYFDCRS